MRNTEYALLLEEIRKVVYDPVEDFHFENDKLQTLISLKADPRLFFEFNRKPSSFGSFMVRYSRYDPIYSIRRNKDRQWLSLAEAVNHVGPWLNDHAVPRLQELHTPDFMEESLKAHCKQALQNFQTALERQFALSEEQHAYIVSELRSLTKKLDTLSKRDFKALAKMTLSNIASKIIASAIVEGGKALMGADVLPVYWEIVRTTFSIWPRLMG